MPPPRTPPTPLRRLTRLTLAPQSPPPTRRLTRRPTPPQRLTRRPMPSLQQPAPFTWRLTMRPTRRRPRMGRTLVASGGSSLSLSLQPTGRGGSALARVLIHRRWSRGEGGTHGSELAASRGGQRGGIPWRVAGLGKRWREAERGLGRMCTSHGGVRATGGGRGGGGAQGAPPISPRGLAVPTWGTALVVLKQGRAGAHTSAEIGRPAL